MATDNRTNLMDSVREIPTQVLGYAKNTLTPESAWTKEESESRAIDRSVYRNGMTAIINRYKGKEDPAWQSEKGKVDLKTIEKYQKELRGDLEISYDELTWNPKFLQDARTMYKAEYGFDFRESDHKLKDYAFSKFNAVEQNIGITGGALVLDNMFYSDFDEKQLQATANAYKTFTEVDWTGKGSRDFASQFIDFFGNTVTDPVMYGTGYTAGWVAKGAKLVGKKLFSKTVADHMASLIGLSAYSGSLSAAHSSNVQNTQKDLGLIDEVSGLQVAGAAVLGAAIPPVFKGTSNLLGWGSRAINTNFGLNIPIIGDINALAGNVQRSVKKPTYSIYGKNVETLEADAGTVKGKTAAFIGTVLNVEKNIVQQKSTTTANKDFYNAVTDDVINPMNETIQKGYNNLSYKDMSAASMAKIKIQVDELIKQNKTNPNFVLQGEIKDLYDLLIPVKKIAENKSKIKAYKQALIDHEAALVAHRKEVALINKKNAAINKTNLNKPFDWEAGAPKNQQLLFEIPKAPVKPRDPGIKNPVTEAMLKSDKVDKVFQQLRTAIYNQQDGVFKRGDNLTANAYDKLYNILRVEQRSVLSTNGDKLAWDALQTATRDFKDTLKNLPLGKKFATVLHYNKLANNAKSNGSQGNYDAFTLQAQEEAGNLLDYIIKNKNSLNHLKQFKSVLQNIDKRTGNVVAARSGGQEAATAKEMEIAFTKKDFQKFPELSKLDGVENKVTRLEFIESYAQEYTKKLRPTNESYESLLGIIKSKLGRNLETSGTESLSKILERDDGFELIGFMFPEMKNDLLNIKKLGQYLDKHVAPKHSQSVIVNMTIARAAQDIGKSTIGEKGSGLAVLGAFFGLDRWRNLINNKYFQQSMAEAINNKGRISTNTANRLRERLNFDDKGIRELQDGISNLLLVQIPAIKNQENIKRKAKRMME